MSIWKGGEVVTKEQLAQTLVVTKVRFRPEVYREVLARRREGERVEDTIARLLEEYFRLAVNLE